MAQWNYRLLTLKPGHDPSSHQPTVPSDLELAGAEGWEAVGFVTVDPGVAVGKAMPVTGVSQLLVLLKQSP